MDHFAGLDVSVKETSVCIVDEMGKIVREVKMASEPEALLAVRCIDLSRHRRRARPLPKIQVSRGGIWADLLQISIRRERLEWQDIALRR